LFNFFSPSNRDGYFRFSLDYDLTDQWKLTGGTNIPWGEDDHTDFAQMKKNKNAYLIREVEFVPVGLHQLVPDDVDTQETRG